MKTFIKVELVKIDYAGNFILDVKKDFTSLGPKSSNKYN